MIISFAGYEGGDDFNVMMRGWAIANHPLSFIPTLEAGAETFGRLCPARTRKPPVKPEILHKRSELKAN